MEVKMSNHHDETSTYKRDGIIYEITVQSEEDGYFGIWYCTECEERGGSSKKCETLSEAKQLAKNNTGGHHSANHRS